MIQTLDEIMQNHPLVKAANELIDYSVQLRQHGDRSFRDNIVRFKEKDEISAWKKSKSYTTWKIHSISRCKSRISRADCIPFILLPILTAKIGILCCIGDKHLKRTSKKLTSR